MSKILLLIWSRQGLCPVENRYPNSNHVSICTNMFKQDNGGDTELKAIAIFMGSVRSDSIEEEDQHYNETE